MNKSNGTQREIMKSNEKQSKAMASNEMQWEFMESNEKHMKPWKAYDFFMISLWCPYALTMTSLWFPYEFNGKAMRKQLNNMKKANENDEKQLKAMRHTYK